MMALYTALRFPKNVAGALSLKALCTVRKSHLNGIGKCRGFNVAPTQSQVIRCMSTNTLKSGHHSTLWTAERALSLGLIGILPTAIAFPSQGLDALMAISIVMHQHWGLEAVVTDYVRPIMFGNIIPKVAHGILFVFSIATLGGLFYFIYNDIGLSRSIRKLWNVQGQ